MAKSHHVLNHGRLQYVAATKATLTVATPLAHHKVVHLTFGRSGIFVQFPYFRHRDGIASSVTLESRSSPPHKLKLDEHGKVTSHLVKLSHHIDGSAHFSQDGKVLTQIRRKSFRLDNSIGPVFQLFAFWLSGFDVRDSTTVTDDRAYVQFQSLGSHVFGVNIQGEWRCKKGLADNIEGTGPAGPVTSVIHRKTGVNTQVAFLGSPVPHPLDSHVLMVACSRADPPAGVTTPMIILIGGWDHAEVHEGDPPVEQTGCLACLYPVASADQLAQRIGSIDLRPPPSVIS